MAEFFGSVLFTRILIAVFMVSVVALVGIGIGSIVNKKKNKLKSKALTNTKAEKEIITEKETEKEVEEQKSIEQQVETELGGVSEFEHNGVKYLKYTYGESQCVCKSENGAKWMTMAQSLQNTGKLEKSKDNADNTLIVNNSENVLECFITGNKEELTSIAENSLKEYNTEIKSNIKEETTTNEKPLEETAKENEA